jgi:hypothetical protein
MEKMMKAAFATILLACASLTGAASADTGAATGQDCPLSGPIAAAGEACQTLRAAYTAKVSDCLAERHAAAASRTDGILSQGSHTSRASYLICTRAARKTLGLTGD